MPLTPKFAVSGTNLSIIHDSSPKSPCYSDCFSSLSFLSVSIQEFLRDRQNKVFLKHEPQ